MRFKFEVEGPDWTESQILEYINEDKLYDDDPVINSLEGLTDEEIIALLSAGIEEEFYEVTYKNVITTLIR